MWVVLVVLAILILGGGWLMFATPRAGTHHVEKVVPLGTLAR